MCTTSCVACGGSLGPFGKRRNYDYRRCIQCGTIQLAPLPSKADLDEAYNQEYASAAHIDPVPEARNAAGEKHFRAILDALRDHGVRGRVLDYGTGWGGLCQLLIDNGFECEAIELSKEMVSYCQKRGLPVRHGDITTVDRNDFSALALSCVFEHLVNHEDWLARAYSLLRDDGLLVSMQPTARFACFMAQALRLGIKRLPLPALHQTLCPPWHTVLFSLDGMAMLATRHGFELLEIRRAPQGAERGMTGLAQGLLNLINRGGWRAMGTAWPLVIGHIFVFRKVPGHRVRDRRSDQETEHRERARPLPMQHD